MSNQFLKLRRSSIPGKVPTTSSLEFGEIALNTYDGLAFLKKSGSNGEEIVTIGGTASGSFTGSLFGTASYSLFAISSSYSTNILGSEFYVAVYNGENSLSTGSIYDSGSFTAVGNTAPLDSNNPDRFFVDAGNTTSYNLISAHGEIDNYLQLNVQNFSYGATASSDIVATANNGTQNDNYIDVGINNSGYNLQNGIGGPNDAYVYSTGNDLYIGNSSDGKKIVFFNGSGNALSNARLTILDSGLTQISGSLSVSDVSQNNALSGSLVAVNPATGLLQYTATASWALNALTASYATSFSGSIANAISASYAATASFVPASGIVGDLSRIATGSVTASVGVGTSSFQLASSSINFITVDNRGNIGIGNPNPFSGSNAGSGSVDIGVFNTQGSSNLFVRGYSTLGSLQSNGYGAVGSNYYVTGSSLSSPFARYSDLVSAIDFAAGGFRFVSANGTANTQITFTTLLNLFRTGNLVLQTSAAGGNLSDLGYKLSVSGSGASGSLNVDNRLYVSGSTVQVTGSLLTTGSLSHIGTSSFTGNTTTDGGQLGAELLSTSGWTSTGWTGDYTVGFTHTIGNTTALTNTLAAANSFPYQIALTVSGRTAGSFTYTFGGITSSAISATSTTYITAISTGALSITPTTDFDGTIIISIKLVSTGTPLITLRNSSGNITNAIFTHVSSSNVSVGFGAGARIISGIGNTSIGNVALGKNVIGSSNVAIGNGALATATYVYQSVAIGESAAQLARTSFESVAIGFQSATSATTAANITSIGWRAGYLNSVGTGWIALGSNAGASNVSGSSWIALGGGGSNETGSNWIAIGVAATQYYSGSSTNATNFSNGVYIGASTKVGGAGATNETVIGYLAEGQGSNRTVIGNSSTTYTWLGGNLLLGTTTGSVFRLDVSGSGRFTNNLTVSGSSITTGSFTLIGNEVITGSSTATLGYTGSLFGTASWALNALTASFVPSSAIVGDLSRIATGSVTASVGVGTASFQLTSGNSTFLFVSSSGNVGIGTTVPTGSLEVVGGPIIVKTDAVTGAITSGSRGIHVYSQQGIPWRLTTFSNNLALYAPIKTSNAPTLLINLNDATDAILPVIRFGGGISGFGYRHFWGINAANTSSYTSDFVVKEFGNIYAIGVANTGDSLTAGIKPNGSAYFSSSVLIGTTTESIFRLDVSGSSRFSSNVQITGSLTVATGSFTVITGSGIEFQVTDTGTKIGNLISDTHQVTGSINLSGSLSVLNLLTIESASIDYQQNLAVNNTAGWQTVVAAATASYRAAFFDYVLFSGSIGRSGTVTTFWSASATEYYENFTEDLGGSTTAVQLQTAISASQIVLQATGSSAAWTVRSLVRLL